MPFEDLSDKEDIDSDDEKDKSLDNMEGIKAVSIQNAFVEVKDNLLDYRDYDVRSSAIEAALAKPQTFAPYITAKWKN